MDFKEIGNKYFTEKKYRESIYYYTKGIEQNPTAVLHTNAATAYIKIFLYEEAYHNAQKALELDSYFIKASHMRKSLALKSMNKKEKAIKTCKEGLQISPKDRPLLEMLDELQTHEHPVIKHILKENLKELSKLDPNTIILNRHILHHAIYETK
jgi:RNA polymerase II-associated protein 3